MGTTNLAGRYVFHPDRKQYETPEMTDTLDGIQAASARIAEIISLLQDPAQLQPGEERALRREQGQLQDTRLHHNNRLAGLPPILESGQVLLDRLVKVLRQAHAKHREQFEHSLSEHVTETQRGPAAVIHSFEYGGELLLVEAHRTNLLDGMMGFIDGADMAGTLDLVTLLELLDTDRVYYLQRVLASVRQQPSSLHISEMVKSMELKAMAEQLQELDGMWLLAHIRQLLLNDMVIRDEVMGRELDERVNQPDK